MLFYHQSSPLKPIFHPNCTICVHESVEPECVKRRTIYQSKDINNNIEQRMVNDIFNVACDAELSQSSLSMDKFCVGSVTLSPEQHQDIQCSYHLYLNQ